ncbi:MAG TPA: flagellar biosynthetic protein FliO [Clostridia bacterium]|nr:flagellar biosynthetic protein FliO [Clostridia bacterium]
MLGYLLTLLVSLVIVVVFFFLAWVFTRLVASNGSFNGKGQFITILERFPVTKDSSILLVKTFDKVMLIGVTPHGMTTLNEYDAEGIDIQNTEFKKQSFSEIMSSAFDSAFPDGKVRKTVDRMLKKGKGGKKGEQ